MLGASFTVCGMVSEENEKVIKVPAPNEKQRNIFCALIPRTSPAISNALHQ